MQCHRDLNEPLQKSLFGSGSGAPDVLPGFMRFKEVGAIEIVHGAQVEVLVHSGILRNQEM